jgi:hypothetical protein
MPATNFTRVRSGSLEQLFGSKLGANKLLWLFSDSGTDDGATFQSIAETAAFDMGSEILTKYIRRIRLLGRGKFLLQVKRNYGLGIYKTFTVDLNASSSVWNAGNWNVGVWGPDSILKEGVIDTDLFGRHFQLRFTDAETTAGQRPVAVGSLSYSIPAGEWAVYGSIMEGHLLGVRE